MCGIYQIVNKVNGKVYIGRSKDIHKRWKSHISNLNKGKHINKALQQDWNEYEEDNFDFEVIRTCNEDELNYAELEEIFKIDEDRRYNNSNIKDEFVMSMINEGYQKFKIDYKNKKCADKRPLNFNFVAYDEEMDQYVYVSISNTEHIDENKNQIKRNFVDNVGGIMVFLEHKEDENSGERLFRLTS